MECGNDDEDASMFNGDSDNNADTVNSNESDEESVKAKEGATIQKGKYY